MTASPANKPEGASSDSPFADLGADIAFEHKVFNSVEAPYFRLSDHDGAPVMMIKYGDAEASLPFHGIRNEFGLDPAGHDSRMLDAVAMGLNFIKVLKVGDPIPSEVLTGEPSWEVSEEHRRIALQRLTMQLVSWLAGDEQLITNPAELVQLAEDPATQKKVNDAFDEAAEAMGIGRENKDQVTDILGEMAEEFAHIEALRETFGRIAGIQASVLKLEGVYSNDLSMEEIMSPVKKLMETAVQGFRKTFGELDGQTGEILTVLKNIPKHKEILHATRDELFRRFLAWEQMLIKWNTIEMARSRHNEDLLRDTYKFLAPRFMHTDDWLLSTVVLDKKVRSTEMVW